MNKHDRSHRLRPALRIGVAATLISGVAALSMPSQAWQGITGAARSLRARLTQEQSVPQHQFVQNASLASAHRPLPRFVYPTGDLVPGLHTGPALQSHAGASTAVALREPVQTFDIMRPPPDFTPLTSQQEMNLYPIWTNDEAEIIYSSNLPSTVASDPAGKFHLWIAPADGGTPIQLTSGSGNEYFPVLSPSNNAIAYTSDANSPGVQNLYVMPFTQAPPAPVLVDNQTSLTIRTDGPVGFAGIGRPAWASSEDRIAFSAKTTTDKNATSVGHTHIYYLYLSTGGFQPTNAGPANVPGKLTDGPEDDGDATWSPDGRYITFASNAGGFTNTGQPVLPNPSQPAKETTAVATTATVKGQAIFLLNSDGTVPSVTGVNDLTATGGRITATGNFDGGPAWSYTSSNFPGYLAFHRLSASKTDTVKHNDVYVLRVISDTATGSVLTEDTSVPSLLNTSDPNNIYDDSYPAWPAFAKHVSLAYVSNRSITYNAPGSNYPLETAVSLADGANGVGAKYAGILESEYDNINPPTLLHYDDNEIVHVTGDSVLPGVATRNINPGQPVTFIVRLSNRETGVDDKNVFIQIKDPDSRYQDASQREHKIYTTDREYGDEHPEEVAASQWQLFNAGIGNAFVFDTTSKNYYELRGAVGTAFDGGHWLTVGHHPGGGKNIVTQGGTQYRLLGDDPSLYKPWGQEYECQYVNPHFAGTDTVDSDYGFPVYVPGIDDAAAHKAPTSVAAGWLQLHRSATQDHNGGVLYTVTWKTPSSRSDYYIDVIAYDKSKSATDPSIRANWRIYDNVWGFTTQTFNASHQILVVSDNALGQKFRASQGSTLGGGTANLRPIFYGAESYFTDLNETILPNATWLQGNANGYPQAPQPPPAPVAGTAPTALAAYPTYINEVTLQWAGVIGAAGYDIYRSKTATGVVAAGNLIGSVKGEARDFYVDTGNAFTDPIEGTAYSYVVTVRGQPANASAVVTITPKPVDLKQWFPTIAPIGVPGQNPVILRPVLNGLGHRSSFPESVVYQPDAPKMQYDIWRTLSRGAITTQILNSYAPKFIPQPAIPDLKEPPASFPNALKCVVWISPYTGELLVGPGSLASPDTQNNIIAPFVKSGGRLFVSGQDVASSLTNGGTTNNTPGDGFLPDILGAVWASGEVNGDKLTPVNAVGHSVSFDPFFNRNTGAGAYTPWLLLNSDGTISTQNPALSPNLFVSNDEYYVNGGGAAFRTDGAMNQFQPVPLPFGNGVALGKYDSVLPGHAGSVTDITTIDGNPGLLYYVDANSGARVVLSSFGLEGMGIEYYKVTVNKVDYYLPYNNRPNVLYNATEFLRTGTVSGTIVESSGTGTTIPVAGATVYLRSNDLSAVPGMPTGRTAYSALTSSDGSFKIEGVVPGNYVLYGSKFGYVSARANDSILVNADETYSSGLDIEPVNPGSISGHVTGLLSGKPVAGATVSFTGVNGVVLTTTTDNSGAYSFAKVPSAPDPGVEYTGTAKFKKSVAGPTTIAVRSGRETVQDFVLPPQPGTISGVVTDSSTKLPIKGAIVYFVPIGSTIPQQAVTDATGKYVSPDLYPGDYTVTATVGLKYEQGVATITLVEEGKVTRDFALAPILKGTLTGKVTYEQTGKPVYSATVTFVSGDGKLKLTGRTDLNGIYTIANVPSAPLPGATYVGSALRLLAVSDPPTVTVVVPSGATIKQNFILKPGLGGFQGAVTDAATGAGLVGATIVLTSADGTPTTTVTSTAGGSYSAPNLLPGTYTVAVSDEPNYIPATFTKISLPDSVTLTKNFVLHPVLKGTITGHVYFRDGRTPAKGAVVDFGTGSTATTAVDGTYTIRNVPTQSSPINYKGTATLRGVSSPAKTITIGSGQTVTQNLILPAVPGNFRGTVIDPATSKGLVGATVTVSNGTGVVDTQTTGAGGTYKTKDLPAGTYKIDVTDPPNYLPATTKATLKDNDDLIVNFGISHVKPATITGHVYYRGGTRPAAGAVVTFDGGLTATTAANGIYTITNVPTQSVPVSLSGSATIRGVSSDQQSVTVTSGATSTRDFVLPAVPGNFAGTVTDSVTHTALSGATVTITTATGTLADTETTDGKGAYKTPDLPPGSYLISVADEPYYLPIKATDKTTLPDNGNVIVNFALKPTPPGTIGGLITIGTHGLTAAATVTVKDSASKVVTTVTSTTTRTTAAPPNGDNKSVNYSVKITKPGNYTVTITRTGFDPIVLPVSVTLNTFVRADANIPPIITLPAGTSMISVPYDYSGSSWDALFGAVNTNRSRAEIYQPLQLQYVQDPTPPADYPRPGLGYWLRLKTDTDVIIPGKAIAAATISVALHPYWNQIGTPSTSAINVADLKFQTSTGIYTFVQATSSATGSLIIDPTLYGVENGANVPLTGTGQLQPWKGYWIKAYQDVTVIIPTTSSTPNVRR